MKTFRVYFTFNTPANRGKASILWEANSVEEAYDMALKHLQDVIPFKDLSPVIEEVVEATLEDFDDFAEAD